jgi:N-acetylmuramoyl-L-alanine amidase
MTLIGSTILPRIVRALRARIQKLPTPGISLKFMAPLAGAIFMIAQVAPAKAVDMSAVVIPEDMHIDFSSIVVPKDQLVCLALNDYWEARSETMAGRIAVARVVLNRAMDPRFPSNICDVVKQTKVSGPSNRCQFSWYCDAKDDVPYEADQWRTSLKIATAVLQVDSSIPDPTGGALWYHADFTRPAWALQYETTTIIGTHVFYREPDTARAKTVKTDGKTADGKVVAARKPFIYRMNAFAEYVTAKNARSKAQTYASAGTSSPVAVQNGPAPAQPLAR